jgi:hypothetical protein
MLDWLGAEGNQLRIAFTKVFSSRYEPFGSAPLRVGGLSDGKAGVQWSVGYDPDTQTRFVSVNLEGKQYKDWPVALLIERELKQPTLVSVVRAHDSVADVMVHWRRELWQGSARPPILEGDIGGTPMALGELTEESWRSALGEALDCLAGGRTRRVRARQTVTRASGEQVEGVVSPHLVFKVSNGGDGEWEAFLRDARSRMQPLHDWATARAGHPVKF